MNHFQTSVDGNPTKKSGHLSITQIAHLIAQSVVEQHQEIGLANRSWVYATDQDKFLDFHAYQSVNANPATEQGVHA